MSDHESATPAATDAWIEAHGQCRPLLWTTIESAKYGTILVSTVISGTGHSMRDGFFATYETKVFGGPCNTLADRFTSHGGRRETVLRFTQLHTMTISHVVNLLADDMV